MVDFILHLTPGYLYPGLLLGLITTGGFVLLPAIYMSIIGNLNLNHLFMIVLLAGVASDSLWYYIGNKARKDRLYRLSFVKKRMREAEKFSTFFSRHGVLLVFMTKFIYGTRIASHVLAGMHKIKYVRFVLATSLGTAIWFWIFYALVKTVDNGLATAKTTALRIQLLLLIVTIIMLLLNWFTGTYVRKKLLKRGESRGS